MPEDQSILGRAFTASRGHTSAAGRASLEPLFLVTYKPGAAWRTGRALLEQPLLEHAKYMFGLFVSGALKLAGGFSDDSGGAAVFGASDDAAANAVIANDPAVISEILIPELHRWDLVDWQNFAGKI